MASPSGIAGGLRQNFLLNVWMDWVGVIMCLSVVTGPLGQKRGSLTTRVEKRGRSGLDNLCKVRHLLSPLGLNPSVVALTALGASVVWATAHITYDPVESHLLLTNRVLSWVLPPSRSPLTCHHSSPT